ncbi:MAG: radical SAM family heme chaperone HemW [Deltaproteobacteria bacterium]|jgi:oxygen-independent coproporphyrinogen III oxidase|nr:radical SAM family heme chaperone HemW [Deltaproteobacteria bacterium]MBT4087379.1 radical SAM family heme chaperone HemW [Deltaproteobacteria bacterium]MBT4267268.1 radical SAM family heme chaperone HemW [Deltaproteobacteria bacterium]MBT4639360.1 radical SAM family heme chaperone HemW [Deltaproteobacteria bacterium]MBT7715507.1 radical SAM family heme chaperone HemW [Deltaproteobacteria bacterium]
MTIPALYIHIPFCQKICPFCSFAVRRDDLQKHTPYFDMVKKEFALLTRAIPLDFSGIKSIYFGGGTPSRLPLTTLEQWVAWLDEKIGGKSRAQRSIEANPEDLSLAYGTGLVHLGFNRISLGVQSFWGQGLELLKRQHTPADSRQAISNVLQVGINDFNLDLMFGYPGQRLEHLQADLAEFVHWKPTHISAYCLNIEERTPLFKKPQWQRWQDDNETLIADMYRQVVLFLEDHGYRQYEVSNFAKKGHQSKQNLYNWCGKNYLGLGMGAHSLVYSQRWGNHKRWVDYKNALTAGRLPQQYHESLDLMNKRDEVLMLNLRQKKGLNLPSFESVYALDLEAVWGDELEKLESAGLVKTTSHRLQLTIAGLLLADEITAVLASLLDTG